MANSKNSNTIYLHYRLLQVLDIGFNLLSAIPDNGFRGVRALTLLALDGNPLTTVPERAFTHLNTSLRGLSVGKVLRASTLDDFGYLFPTLDRCHIFWFFSYIYSIYIYILLLLLIY